MLVWKKILWLRERVREQRNWIDSCGGSLAGYIVNYGDPGTPPLDKNGEYKIIRIPVKDQHLTKDLEKVPGTEDQFYMPHAGSGGTAIFEADDNRLKQWERELMELEGRNYSATQKANIETKRI